VLWKVNCEDDESTHGYVEGRVCVNLNCCILFGIWFESSLSVFLEQMPSLLVVTFFCIQKNQKGVRKCQCLVLFC
jgi:hypothetical protein